MRLRILHAMAVPAPIGGSLVRTMCRQTPLFPVQVKVLSFMLMASGDALVVTQMLFPLTVMLCL